MPDTTIYRGLMNAATQTPTDPAARLRAIQQRMQARRQVTGRPTPPRQQTNAAPRQFSAPVAAPQQNMPSTPSAPPMQAPAAASTQGMPQRPQGMPPAPSGINPTVPGVTMPDSARAPRMNTAAAPRPIGGLMAPTPYEQS